MVFHSTLPEVLTGFGVVHPEDKGVLLFFALGRIGVRVEEKFSAQCTLIKYICCRSNVTQCWTFYIDESHAGPASI